MEEIRQTALARYARFSPNVKKNLAKIFSGADGDGDGRITFTEFVTIFKLKDEDMGDATRIFQEFDRDPSHVYAGTLDYEQVISFSYLLSTGRTLFCAHHGCDEFLKGAYFTCKQCFPTRRYDLCCNCFRRRNFTHHHQVADFCDNYALLMTNNVTSSPQPIPSSSVPTTYPSSPFTTSSSTGHMAKEVALHVLEGAAAVSKGMQLHHSAKAVHHSAKIVHHGAKAVRCSIM